jgi:hypothetical protein
VILVIQKGNYELKIRCESDLLPASKEHVYCVGFYTTPYIWVYIQSWHTWPAQREATSCTRFYVQDWRWIWKFFDSNPCELILLHWFLRWYLYLFKISCRAEVVTSLCKSVTATSGLTSSGCRPHTSSIWPWSGAPKVCFYGTFIGSLRQKIFLCGIFMCGGNWQGHTSPHTLVTLKVCRHLLGGEDNCPQKLWYVNTKNYLAKKHGNRSW